MTLRERSPRTVSNLKDDLANTKKELKDFPRQVAQMEALIGTHAFDKGIKGVSYATEAADREKRLTHAGEVQKLLVVQGEKLEGLLDREVRVPELPSGLLLPHDEIQLTPVLIPDMDDLTPEKMQRILNGEKSPYKDIFPEKYMQEVMSGRLPYPLGEPYIALVDRKVTRRNPDTPLSHAAGIEDLAGTPISHVRDSLRRDGRKAIRELHLDPEENAIKPLSAREAILFRWLGGNEDTVTTNSRRFGTDNYVVYDGREAAIDIKPGESSAAPTKLVVVTRPLAPEKYLKKH